MRMLDLIEKKKNGGKLTGEEIRFAINGYVGGEIPDYQMSAMLMAIWFKGMDAEETAQLTLCMEHSGEVIDLSSIPGVKVDKHSTGGVGDKTTLIVAPAAAACGVKIAKMSGRGLGHTGGTLDKLESIPGFRINLTREEFFDTVRRTGIAVIGQTGNVVPADKMLYALRDVTATVDSIPLIASSIMSKKLAAGSDAILLDVKTGSGAFMKTEEDSMRLAKAMVEIGSHAGRRVTALITDMDVPLGNCVGNALEVKEAVEVLNGGGPSDLREVCIHLTAEMILLSKQKWGSPEKARKMAAEAIESGQALRKFCEMVKAQGGDENAILHPELLPTASVVCEVKSDKDGYISRMNAEGIGTAAMLLGAGRETKDQAIDHAAGIRLLKKTGDFVRKGEVVAQLYTNEESRVEEASKVFCRTLAFSDNYEKQRPLILVRISGSKS